MTHAQRTAIESPCYFGFETANPRYWHKAWPATLVLSVNAGYE